MDEINLSCEGDSVKARGKDPTTKDLQQHKKEKEMSAICTEREERKAKKKHSRHCHHNAQCEQCKESLHDRLLVPKRLVFDLKDLDHGANSTVIPGGAKSTMPGDDASSLVEPLFDCCSLLKDGRLRVGGGNRRKGTELSFSGGTRDSDGDTETEHRAKAVKVVSLG